MLSAIFAWLVFLVCINTSWTKRLSEYSLKPHNYAYYYWKMNDNVIM
jgi:hypothetical protein